MPTPQRCHHRVSIDTCPVCARVPALKATPIVPRLLHLALDQGAIVPEKPLCGQMSPEDRLSTLWSHDARRFCKTCLARHEEEQAKLRPPPRSFSEKAKAFNQELHRVMTHPSHLDTLVIPMFLGAFFLGGGLGSVVGFLLAGWSGAAIFGGLGLFLTWRSMVKNG